MHAGHLLDPHLGGLHGVEGDKAQGVPSPECGEATAMGAVGQRANKAVGRARGEETQPGPPGPSLVSRAPGTESPRHSCDWATWTLPLRQPGRLGAHPTHIPSHLEGNLGLKSRHSPSWGPLRNLRTDKNLVGQTSMGKWGDPESKGCRDTE